MFNTGMSAKGWFASGGKKALLPFLVFGIFAAGIFLYSTQKTFSQTTVQFSNVRAENITDTSANILWDTDVAVDTSAVYYDTTSGSYTFASSDICSPNGGVSETKHCVKLSGLDASATYYYIAEIYDVENDVFIQSAEYSFSTTTSSSTGSPPSAPTLSTPDVSGNDVYLNWTDSDTEEKFNVYRSDDGGSTFNSIQSVSADTTSYTDTGLADGTYYYKIKACNTEGCTESNIESATVDTSTSDGTTNDTTDAPVAPSDLIAEVSSDYTKVFLSWTDNATNEESYKIYKALSGSTLDLYDTKSSDTTSYTDSQVTEGESYDYGVSACNTHGCSSMATISVIAGSSDSTTDSALDEVKTIKGNIFYPDGSAVTDAVVGAYKSATGEFKEVKTDSTGFYSMKVTGGSWEVSIFPETSDADWSYDKEPKKVSFAEDNTTEEKTIDFTVSSSDAAITGKVVKEDGTPPDAGTTFVSFESSEGFSHGAEVLSDGSFSVSVAEGSYSGFVYSEDPLLGNQEIGSVSVNAGEIKDIGTITLKTNSEHITGKVTDDNGNALSGVTVNAWQPDSEGYATTTTDSFGKYDLLVSEGTWEVYAESFESFQNPEHPQSVEVVAGELATADFMLTSTDATVSGSVVDTAGNALTDVYGWIEFTEGFEGSSFGGPIEGGKFSFALPSGTYNMFVHLSPDSPYTSTGSKSVGIVAGSNTVNAEVTKNTAFIRGYLKDENGSIVTGHEAHVFATTGEGGAWQGTIVNSSTGEYKLKVSAGTWYLGYDIDPSSGFISSERPSINVSVNKGDTENLDITVKKAGATITGTVTDPDGNAVAGVYIGVSEISFKEAASGSEFKDPVIAEARTDSAGKYTIGVPAGDYYVKTFVRHLSGWLAAPEQNIGVNEGQTQVRDFKLRRPSVKIKGTVYRKLEGVSGAFVWAWSETGGFQQTMTDANGKYEIPATSNEEWVVAAAKDINGLLYRSEETLVSVGAEDISRIIEITAKSALPSSESKTINTGSTTVAQIPNKVKVLVPANAISTTGPATLSLNPDARIVSQGGTKVVGNAYDIEARDSSGKLVTSFKADVNVDINYTDKDLQDLGISEDNLRIAFWDDTAGVWRIKKRYVINKGSNTVQATTSHFTRFALLTVVPTVDISAILDGDLIKTADNPDVYIAKKIGNKKFKRLILNPDIFNAYGHLTWDSIKTVTQAQMDAFVLSGLTVEVYPDGTPVNGNVYQVSSDPGSDVGVSRWVNMPAQAFESAGFDWDSIYHINEFEASPDFYPAGPPITSV